MDKSPKISVIMPVYNASKYLSEAIQSILTQTFFNFELIISYDKSSDNSLEIIKRYQNIDDRIVLLTGDARGLVRSLNDAINISRGEYIARMDADDISMPNRFEDQLEFMESNLNVGVCGSWIEVFGENIKNSLWKLPTSNDEIKTRLLFSVTFAHPSVMMRKGLIDGYNLYYKEEYKFAEDYKFWLDFSHLTQFANISKVLLRHRYLESSASRVSESEKNDIRYNVIKKIFEKVLDKLNIKNTEEENRLHFILGLNERIEKEDVDLKFLDVYLNKVVESNRKKNVFNQKYLEQFLAKKFLTVVFFKIKRKKIELFSILRSKYFYIGLISVLKEKVATR